MAITELDAILSIIKKIKDNPKYSIEDKLSLFSSVIDITDKQCAELLDTCRYCKYCNQYYINKSWKVERKSDIVEKDISDVYLCKGPINKKWYIEFDECTCPMGHKIRENMNPPFEVE